MSFRAINLRAHLLILFVVLVMLSSVDTSVSLSQQVTQSEPKLEVRVRMLTQVLRRSEDLRRPIVEVEVWAPSPVSVTGIDVGCTCLVPDVAVPFTASNNPTRFTVRLDPDKVSPGEFSYSVSLRGESTVIGLARITYKYMPLIRVSPQSIDAESGDWGSGTNRFEVNVTLADDVNPAHCEFKVRGGWRLHEISGDGQVRRLTLAPERQKGEQESRGVLSVSAQNEGEVISVPLRVVFAPPFQAVPAAVLVSQEEKERVVKLSGRIPIRIEKVECDAPWLKLEATQATPVEWSIRVALSQSISKSTEHSVIRIWARADDEIFELNIPIVRSP